MTAHVTLYDVSHFFGDFCALQNVSLEIESGQFVVLLGPSGCGKTTLLSILGGFLRPTRGRVLISGKDVTRVAPAKRPTTTMFQDYALFPHMNLLDNVGFGPRMRGESKKSRDQKAREMLALVGLPDAGNKKPHELSGGQRQRVALARALAVGPEVLLLDEPLGALDLKLRRQMQDELKEIQRRVGTTFIHVTHDQEEAMAIADLVVVMNAGAIQHAGSTEEVYLRPRNRFTASFMGDANFLSGEVLRHGEQELAVRTALGDAVLPLSCIVPGSVKKDQPVELCLRPEHFRLNIEGPGVLELGRAVIADLAFFGAHYRCHLRLEGANGEVKTLVAHYPQHAAIRQGDSVPVKAQASDIIVLRSE